MNKLANFAQRFYVLGSNQAAADMSNTKTAGLESLLPKSRLGKAALGVGAGAAGLMGLKAMGRDEPSTLENLYAGGKDMLSNMSREELMGYAELVNKLRQGDAMGYDASMGMQADAYPYEMEDIGYYDQPMGDSMGYASQMSPSEIEQYVNYYSSMA